MRISDWSSDVCSSDLKAVGIATANMKIWAAVISAMLTSIIGTFHITYLTFVDPASAFSLELSIQIAMFALIGGLGTISGPIAGAFLEIDRKSTRLNSSH